ncbi:MAG: peroxidase [Limisphaerales bacterium]|jgi:peroxidase
MKSIYYILLVLVAQGGSINLLAQGNSKFALPFSGMVTETSTETFTEEGIGDPENSLLCTREDNRAIDGSANNVMFCDWGQAGIQQRRLVLSSYTDASGSMPTGLPNPRVISNLIFEQESPNLSIYNLSSFVYTWGQFIDHDIVATPQGDEQADIIVPTGDPYFDPLGTGACVIPFTRSLPDTSGAERQQINAITSWIDASTIYGSDSLRATWLRSFTDGKLKTSLSDMLPFNTVTGQITSAIDPAAPYMDGNAMGMPVFVSGDARANEQPGLLSLHTLFVREHNRICNKLIIAGLTDDELIYQEARRLITGIVGYITYNEFLPALGVSFIDSVNYDDLIQPDISNLFSAAAFRFGHTMVCSSILTVNNDGSPAGEGSALLREVFFRPDFTINNGIDPILKGLSNQRQESIDNYVVDDLRNFLFGEPGAGGFDLVALNIQRGRDHGLPSYNLVRTTFGLAPVTAFSEITTNPDLQLALGAAYASVDEIDIWVALLSEDHEIGKQVGPTMELILRDQFQALRNGDFFSSIFDPAIGNSHAVFIENSSLSKVIMRNTNLTSLPADVFHADRSYCPPPRLLDATVLASEVVLEWQPSHDAVAYQISGKNLGTGLSREVGVSQEVLTIPVSLLEIGAEYEWTVTARCASLPSFSVVSFADTFLIPTPKTIAEDSEIGIYPNPTADHVIINTGIETNSRWTIYNASGIKIMEGRSSNSINKIEFPELNSGHYLLEVKFSDKAPKQFNLIITRN